MTSTTDQPATEAVPASLDVVLQVPMAQLLAAYTERPGPYRGGPDDDGPPPVVLDMIGERVAQILAAEQRDEIRKSVRESLKAAITTQITEAVAEVVNGTVQPTNAYGDPSGVPTTVRALVMAEATTWLTKKTGGYNDQKSNLQAWIAAEVDKAIKADLAESLKAARAQVTQQLQAKAAAAITTTIASMSRGL